MAEKMENILGNNTFYEQFIYICVVYFTTLSETQTTERRMHHSPGGAEENHETLRQDCQCPGRNSNRTSSEYESEGLCGCVVTVRQNESAVNPKKKKMAAR
jgi:hypothetical protein